MLKKSRLPTNDFLLVQADDWPPSDPVWSQSRSYSLRMDLNRSKKSCCTIRFRLTFRRPGWESGTGGNPPGQACLSDPRTGREVSGPTRLLVAGRLSRCRWTKGRTGSQLWAWWWLGWKSLQGTLHLENSTNRKQVHWRVHWVFEVHPNS